MAVVTMNPVFTSISGTVGRMVFYRRYGRTIARALIMPPNPRTQAQQANRCRFRQAMASWQALPDEAKAGYNRRARALSMTGHNLFISEFMKADDGTSRMDGCSPEAALSKNMSERSSFSCTSSPSRRGGREVRSFFSYPACRSVTAPSQGAMTVCSCAPMLRPTPS